MNKVRRRDFFVLPREQHFIDNVGGMSADSDS